MGFSALVTSRWSNVMFCTRPFPPGHVLILNGVVTIHLSEYGLLWSLTWHLPSTILTILARDIFHNDILYNVNFTLVSILTKWANWQAVGPCAIKILDQHIGGIRLEWNTVITVDNDALLNHHIIAAVQVNEITVSCLGLRMESHEPRVSFSVGKIVHLPMNYSLNGYTNQWTCHG